MKARFSSLRLWGCLAALTVPAGAATIASYDSGVTAAAGQAGAADPATQGWLLTRAPGNQFSDGFDSGDGGWRTVDGTTDGPANYSQNIDAAGQTAMTTDPAWTMSWTVALDADAIGSAGGFVGGYYIAPNNGRQNNLVALVDLAADGIGFWITLRVDGANNLLLEDTSGGSGTYNTGLDVASFPNFGTFSLTYDRVAGTAELDYGAGTATLNPGVPLIPGRNAVFFGAGDSGGQGSAVWNEFSIETIPEPSTVPVLITGLSVCALLRRRR